MDYSHALRKAVKSLNIRFPNAQIVKDLEYSKGVVSSYLSGKKTPSRTFIEHFENFYKVSLSDFQIEKPKEPKPEELTTKGGNKHMIFPDGTIMLQVPLVPFPAYASFIEVYEDEYRTNTEFETTYFTVDKIGLGKYIAFTVQNDSMNGGKLTDTPSGAQVLGRELGRQHWIDGFGPTEYGWVILCHNGIFHKDITGMDNEGNIVCESRNPSPEYPPFELNLNEVHSIYKIIKRTF